MRIEEKLGRRVLIKDDNEQVDVSDGSLIEYQGIYHKVLNDIVRIVEVPTRFIGKIRTIRYRHYEGITGLFVQPLYIFDNIKYKWLKIIDYKEPTTKYFFYPHFLDVGNRHLATCENADLNIVRDVTDTFSLNLDLLPY